MHISDIFTDHIISLFCVNTALNKIGRVKNRPEVVTVKPLHTLKTVFRRLAIDILFILVQKKKMLFFCILNHSVKPFKNFLFVFLAPFTLFIGIKAEYSYVSAVKNLCNPYCVFKKLK